MGRGGVQGMWKWTPVNFLAFARAQAAPVGSEEFRFVSVMAAQMASPDSESKPSCRGAIKTGHPCAIKTGIMMSPGRILLRCAGAGTEPDAASAEDKALRGRNLSAVRSLANGRSGRLGGPACPCRSQFKAINPRATISTSRQLELSEHKVSGFDRTENSGFENYTTELILKLPHRKV